MLRQLAIANGKRGRQQPRERVSPAAHKQIPSPALDHRWVPQPGIVGHICRASAHKRTKRRHHSLRFGLAGQIESRPFGHFPGYPTPSGRCKHVRPFKLQCERDLMVRLILGKVIRPSQWNTILDRRCWPRLSIVLVGQPLLSFCSISSRQAFNAAT
jgi:hypothetical protein